jgi:hypothetical protein
MARNGHEWQQIAAHPAIAISSPSLTQPPSPVLRQSLQSTHGDGRRGGARPGRRRGFVLSKKATLAIVVLSLAGAHARGDELLSFDSEAFFLAPDLGPARPASRAASLPGVAPRATAEAPLVAGGLSLHLVWLDPAGAAGSSVSAACDEAERVFKALGLVATWRRASVEEPPRDDEIRVILLDRATLNARHASVLGSTPEHFDGPPHVWIHVPGVRQVLGIADVRRGALDRHDSYALGVALGRVIAHEVVHALAPALPHGEGLMRSSLSRRDLCASSAPVTPRLAAAVSRALADRLASASAHAGVRAAAQERGGPLR